MLLRTVALLSNATSKEATITEKFKQDEIIPDILQVGPASVLCVQFPTFTLTPGANFTGVEKVIPQPVVKWDANPNTNYSLMMLDLDVPSRANPEFRSLHHWLVINIPGSDVSKGREIRRYGRPNPASNTPPHRYVFLVWEQAENFELEKFYTFIVMQEFAEKYKLGEAPVAGNYFLYFQ